MENSHLEVEFSELDFQVSYKAQLINNLPGSRVWYTWLSLKVEYSILDFLVNPITYPTCLSNASTVKKNFKMELEFGKLEFQ